MNKGINEEGIVLLLSQRCIKLLEIRKRIGVDLVSNPLEPGQDLEVSVEQLHCLLFFSQLLPTCSSIPSANMKASKWLTKASIIQGLSF